MTTIDRLPAEVRQVIAGMRASGRTINEILAKLLELEVKVSRSPLGRHIKRLDAARLADADAGAETIRGSLDRLEAVIGGMRRELEQLSERCLAILARLG